MSENTGIEWTDSTWNPVTGCTKVSAGCDHCYAETLYNRFNGPGAFDTVKLHPDRLDKPLRWRKPRRVFVNSMSDLFHDDVPDEYIARVWAVMAYCAPAGHTFQILTKRHGRMRSLLSSDRFRDLFDVEYCGLVDWYRGPLYDGNFVDIPHVHAGPLPNVWLGVSVETQQWADIRIPALLDTPAAVRFLSCEPLLGPVDCEPLLGPVDLAVSSFIGGDWLKGIDWVIVGGESGQGARPMHPDWTRSLRDQCVSAGVPFLFKQWGSWVETANGTTIVHRDGETTTSRIPLPTGAVRMSRVAKKTAGRVLDGRTWDEYPEAVSAA